MSFDPWTTCGRRTERLSTTRTRKRKTLAAPRLHINERAPVESRLRGLLFTTRNRSALSHATIDRQDRAFDIRGGRPTPGDDRAFRSSACPGPADAV